MLVLFFPPRSVLDLEVAGKSQGPESVTLGSASLEWLVFLPEVGNKPALVEALTPEGWLV